MNANKGYMNYKLFARMKQIKKQLYLIYYLIHTVHFVCLTFLMMRSLHPQMQKSGIFIKNIINTVTNTYLTSDILEIFGIASIGMSALSILIFLVRLKIQSNYDEVNEHEKINLVLFYVSIVIRGILEITVYLSSVAYAGNFEEKGFLLFFVQIALPAIVHIFYNYKIQPISLYSYFTIPIIFFITAFQSAFSYLALVGVSMYLLLTDKDIVKKIFFAISTLIALFVLKNQYILRQIDGSDTQIPFIYLLLLIFLLPVLVFKSKSILGLGKDSNINQKCYQTLTNLKAEIPHAQLRFHQFYQLYQNIINLVLSNNEQKSPEIKKILEKQHAKLTKKDFFQLLENYLDKQCKKSTENNTLMHIQRLKVKMNLSYSMGQIFKEIHSLTEQFQRSQKKNAIQFYEIFDQTITKFAVLHKEHLHTAYVIYLNSLHESFEKKTHQLLEKLAIFWKEISQSQLVRKNLDQTFQEILSLENSLENSYTKMLNYESFDTEKNVLHIARTIFNVYENEQKIPSINSQKSDEQSRIVFSFIIMENDTIKFMSKDLLKNLGEKSTLAYENTDKKTLFGGDFSTVIDNMVKKIDPNNQNEWRTVPIICKEGQVELKKIRVMWHPSLESQNRIIIKFRTEQQLALQPFLIYHFKNDTIKYYNSQFISQFGVDKDKFHYQMKNYQFFFNQLFVNMDVPVEDIKSYLKEGNIIRCKMYLKGYVQKGISPAIPVEINIFKCIQVDGQPVFCLMKITKAKQKKLKGLTTNLQGDGINSANKVKQNIQKVGSSNENAWAKKYEKQEFFCKIPNNYESKITQKQAQLQQSGRLVYRHFIHLLFGLLVTAVMVFWILEINFLSDRITSYRKQFVAIQNASEQYALLYQAYSLAIKRYYIQKHPEQIKLVKGLPGFVYEEMYKMAEQASLNEFLRRYLTQINHPPNYVISYDLVFKNFDIDTDSTRSTLMDFAEHIKRGLAITELDFLLKNYNNLRNLTIHFQDSFNFRNKIQDIVSWSRIYFCILVVSSVLLVGIILYVLWKIESAIDIVYGLIEMISVKQLKQSMTLFNEKKKRILNAFTPQVKAASLEIKEKYNQGSFSSISDIRSQTSNNQIQQSQNNVTVKDQISPRKIDKILQNDLNENQVTEVRSLLNHIHHRQQPNRKLIPESFMTILSRKSFFIAIIISFNAIFFFDYISVMNQQTGITQFFQLKQQLYTSLLHIKREEVDAPIRPTFLHYFNNESMKLDDYLTPKLDLAIQVSDQLYFKEFTQFGEIARITLLSNMCSIAGNYTQGSSKPCQKYLNGIVTKGFGQTFDIFMLNAKKVTNQTLAQFGLYPCTQEQCPPYYEHEFVSVLMGQTIRHIIFNLNKQIERIFQVLMESTREKIVYKSIGMLLAIIVYIFCDRSLAKRCKRAIKYFKIIPKEVMCSTKLTTFMRKQKVLSKFDIL